MPCPFIVCTIMSNMAYMSGCGDTWRSCWLSWHYRRAASAEILGNQSESDCHHTETAAGCWLLLPPHLSLARIGSIKRRLPARDTQMYYLSLRNKNTRQHNTNPGLCRSQWSNNFTRTFRKLWQNISCNKMNVTVTMRLTNRAWNEGYLKVCEG